MIASMVFVNVGSIGVAQTSDSVDVPRNESLSG